MVGGSEITSRTGTAGARMLMDKVRMPAAVTAALAGTTAYPGHDYGRVFTDVAVTIAGSDPPGFAVLRVDATVVIAHSDKEDAAGTFKKTYGHYLLTVWCDNTGECLVLKLRPGNAGSNTADDHIEVITAAIAQLPERYRDRLLITVDGAGSSHALVRFLDQLGNDPAHPERTVYDAVGFGFGFGFDDRIRSVVGDVPEHAWATSVRPDGEPRPNGQVTERTGLLRESPDGDRYQKWPKTLRLIARRERPSPGAQLSLFEQYAGFRFPVTGTNLPTGHQVPFLEAAHRMQARVEAFIRRGTDTGRRRLPSKRKTINSSWCVAVAMACDLLAWLRLLALDGDLAKAEPKKIRYRLLRTAARIVRSGRRRELRVPETWPWAHELVTMTDRIQALPNRT